MHAATALAQLSSKRLYDMWVVPPLRTLTLNKLQGLGLRAVAPLGNSHLKTLYYYSVTILGFVGLSVN